MSKRAGHKGGAELERLVEAWLQVRGWRTHRAAAAAVRLPGGKTLTRSHDLFGVFDLVAFRRADTAESAFGETWAIQTTTPTNRSHRRRKIEESAGAGFPFTWTVSVLWHERASGVHRFCLETLLDHGGWTDPVYHCFTPSELTAHRSARAAEKRARREATP